LIREWIDKAAARHGSAVYLEDARGTGTLTYAELREAIRALERRLDDAGLPPGARIAVRMPDPLRYATALVALVAAGRVAVPLDPGTPAADLARVLAVARPAAAVADTDTPEGLAVLELGDPGESAASVRHDSDPAPYGGIFLCTSGTTGAPKGILLGDEQLTHVAASVVSHHKLTAADRGYCSLPLFHVNAEVVGLLATLSAGASLALDARFSRRGFWEMIAERRITWINAVPAIISILAMDPPSERPAVRFIRSASAPLPRAALERFETAFGIPVVETYGMTEAASMITANPVDGPRKAGSAGRPTGTEVRIVAPGGAASPALPVPPVLPASPALAGPGELGRVQIRGKGVIRRYAEGGRPGVIDPDGWLDTGDLGYLDSDGYLFLAGRSDDVINRGGEKIYPREIEEILLAQPGVRAAVVVGVSDEVLGERVVAYVIPNGGWLDHQVEAELCAVCEEQLPRHKQPSAFQMVDQLPLGPTGKVARYRLRELVTAQR
jgi:acyl-CoA synthetase (AMP-forming)/AMP-acid ligase II